MQWSPTSQSPTSQSQLVGNCFSLLYMYALLYTHVIIQPPPHPSDSPRAARCHASHGRPWPGMVGHGWSRAGPPVHGRSWPAIWQDMAGLWGVSASISTPRPGRQNLGVIIKATRNCRKRMPTACSCYPTTFFCSSAQKSSSSAAQSSEQLRGAQPWHAFLILSNS